MSYLTFVPGGTSPSGKTLRYEVIGSNSSIIGRISWYKPWRSYYISTIYNAVFDVVCLREIADFIEKLNKEHKSSDKD